MKKKFFGFGLGAIQVGLYLYEAHRSGNYDGFTIAEVDSALVDTIRKAGGLINVNIASSKGIFSASIPDVVVLNPNDVNDRKKILSALADADEISTAVPSVDFYTRGGANSIAALLSEAVNPGKKQILYASENNNHAAEILYEKMCTLGDASKWTDLQILNTVIGKMSGVSTDADEIRSMGLKELCTGSAKAILVEEFNKIYISRITNGVKCGIPVFEEKGDLLPFEEAKLFGHNAVHSLLAYLAHRMGYSLMSEIPAEGMIYCAGRSAFKNEIGKALVKKYAHLNEPLFTDKGFGEYAENLLERMINPYLRDRISRVCRDPLRKLSFSDRLIGAMRQSMNAGLNPACFADGAYAALLFLAWENPDFCGIKEFNGRLGKSEVNGILDRIWKDEDSAEKGKVADLVLKCV